jgi:hypothetical protein
VGRHPGLAESLPRFHRLARPLLRSTEQGADTAVWLCSAPLPADASGTFWHDRRQRRTAWLPRTRTDAAARRALWDWCARVVAPDLGTPEP